MIRLIRIENGEVTIKTPDDLAALQPVAGVLTWIDIEDGDTRGAMNAMAGRFQIHPLAIASLDDPFDQPRLEEFSSHVMLNARVLTDAASIGADDTVGTADGAADAGKAGGSSDSAGTGLDAADAALVRLVVLMGAHFIITVHAQPLKLIERTIDRMRSDTVHVERQQADFIFYLLLDSLGDSYFMLLDRISEEIDDIDARTTERYDKALQGEIIRAKRRLLKLHKAIAPLRDALLNLRHTESPFISDHVSVYMRDAFENILQLLNMVETYRDVLSTSSEMMMTVASNRMNETITFLTIISSFFIPLTFIVGFYGMNLRMPETQLSVTYPVVIALMAATVLLMFLWFRRKKWL